MKTVNLESVSEKQVSLILEFIKGKRDNAEIREAFINPVLREDILSLLERHCTVIYYPLEHDEKTQNDGFHVRYPVGHHGQERDFVYINTNRPRENQNFTAAHELGHIWKLDRFLEEKLGVTLSEAQVEQAMNRFAAELLMPEPFFKGFVLRTAKQLIEQGNFYEQTSQKVRFSVAQVLQICLAAMYEYFVPYKAVVIRLCETKFLSKDQMEGLLGQQLLKYETIRDFLRSTAHAKGYDNRLFTPDGRKWMEGLKGLLDNAEKRNVMTDSRLRTIRERFDLSVSAQSEDLSKEITVDTKETRDHATGSCH